MDHKLWVIFGPFTLLYEFNAVPDPDLEMWGGEGGKNKGEGERAPPLDPPLEWWRYC